MDLCMHKKERSQQGCEGVCFGDGNAAVGQARMPSHRRACCYSLELFSQPLWDQDGERLRLARRLDLGVQGKYGQAPSGLMRPQTMNPGKRK